MYLLCVITGEIIFKWLPSILNMQLHVFMMTTILNNIYKPLIHLLHCIVATSFQLIHNDVINYYCVFTDHKL